MASDRDMTLLIRIRAAGQQAIAEMRRVAHGIESMASTAGHVSTVVGKGFHGMSVAASAVFAPLRLVAGGALAAGGAMGLLGVHAISASGDMETLRLRLEGVMGSVADANRIFKETEKMSIRSPFTPEQLVEARIGLIGLGLTGRRSLQAIGDASAITQRQMVDLVSSLGGMEAEPLRRIGIALKSENGRYEFTYRDRMQKVRKIVAEGVDAARTSLLSIFEIKYGGGMDRFSAAWKGVTSTLEGNIKIASAKFGDGLMPAAKMFVDSLNKRLGDAIESGAMSKWGERVGGTIEKAMVNGAAAIETAATVWDGMKNAGAEGLRVGFGAVLRAAARIFAISLMEYLGVLKDVFIGLGKMLAGAIGEELLQLPGMKTFRYTGALDVAMPIAKKGWEADTSAFASVDPDWWQKVHRMTTAGFSFEDAVMRWVKDLTPPQQAKLASRSSSTAFEDALKKVETAIPDAVHRVANEIDREFDVLKAQFQAISGVDVEQAFKDSQNKYNSLLHPSRYNTPQPPPNSGPRPVPAGKTEVAPGVYATNTALARSMPWEPMPPNSGPQLPKSEKIEVRKGIYRSLPMPWEPMPPNSGPQLPKPKATQVQVLPGVYVTRIEKDYPVGAAAEQPQSAAGSSVLLRNDRNVESFRKYPQLPANSGPQQYSTTGKVPDPVVDQGVRVTPMRKTEALRAEMLPGVADVISALFPRTAAPEQPGTSFVKEQPSVTPGAALMWRMLVPSAAEQTDRHDRLFARNPDLTSEQSRPTDYGPAMTRPSREKVSEPQADSNRVPQIVIQNLNLRSDNVRQMRNELIQIAGRATIPAGAL